MQKEGLNAEAIHGDKSQQERLQTLEAFKQGGIKVLVATDVAARGLDIVELPAVINFDLPHSPEDYIHRIGRTGRAGATGMALSLMMDKDQRYLADIEKLVQRKLNVEPLAPGVAGRPAEFRAEGVRDPGREGRESREGRGGAAGRDKPVREGIRREGPARRDPAADRDRQARRSGAPARSGKADPFFSRPYEPAADGLEAAPSESQDGLHTSASRRPARKVAALLGGKPNPQH